MNELMTMASETAVKFKDRLQKNRNKLFTFLEFRWRALEQETTRSTPSNHLPALRHIIGGVTTEKGLRDYLVALSVCQTCKDMGVDFLDFLRSGEKDIHAFADSRREQKGRRCSDCCAAVKSTEIKAS